MRTIYLHKLPPLKVMQSWRENGLSPVEIYEKSLSYYLDHQEKLRIKPYKAPKEPRVKIRIGHKRKHDPQKLWELYQDHTLAEIGEIVGITRQRVHQILKSSGYETNSKYKTEEFPMEKAVALRKKRGSFQEIATTLGFSYRIVRKHLKYEERPLSPIGCSNCKSNPYARNLCRTCYNKWCKRGKPSLAEEINTLGKII